jgi:hypothetical protein
LRCPLINLAKAVDAVVDGVTAKVVGVERRLSRFNQEEEAEEASLHKQKVNTTQVGVEATELVAEVVEVGSVEGVVGP